jgi:hypothetical protein
MGAIETAVTCYEDCPEEMAFLIPLLHLLKSLKLCKADERDRCFKVRPHLALGNTAIHKRKWGIHINAATMITDLTH